MKPARKRSWPRSCDRETRHETRGDGDPEQGPVRLLEEQFARLRPARFATGDHRAVRIPDRRRAAGAGQHHQPDPAEQLYRDHGARHAPDHRRRQHRSVGRLDRRLHRRHRRHHDGRLQDTVASCRRPVAAGRRPDRRGAGLFRRLRQNSVLHRDARRHAGVSRAHRQHPARPVRRAFSQRFPEHQFRLHPRRRQRAAAGRFRQRHRRQFPLDLDADRARRRRLADLHLRPAAGAAPRPMRWRPSRWRCSSARTPCSRS